MGAKGGKRRARFIYGEAAVVVDTKEGRFLVVGDLHIGAEKRFMKRGVQLYGASEAMGKRLRGLMEEFSLDSMIILGDVKESVLYPDSGEAAEVRRFFKSMSGYRVIVMRGNHDPHLEEIVDLDIRDEMVAGDCAFMHGHRWPSDEAMRAEFIFAGHNHAAVSMYDSNGARYVQKAWLVARLDFRKAMGRYSAPRRGSMLVIMPAFNDLIVGTPVNEAEEDNLSPLLRNGLFDYAHAKVYSLRGELLGTPDSLRRAAGRKNNGLLIPL